MSGLFSGKKKKLALVGLNKPHTDKMTEFTEEMKDQIREAFVHNVTLKTRYTATGVAVSCVIGEPARETVDVVINNLGEKSDTDFRLESMKVFAGRSNQDFTRAQPRSGRDEMSCKLQYYIDFRPLGSVKEEDLITYERLLEKCFTAACTDKVKTLSIPLAGKLRMDHTGLSNFILDVVTKQLMLLDNTGKCCLKEVRLVLKQNKEKLQQAFWREFLQHTLLQDQKPVQPDNTYLTPAYAIPEPQQDVYEEIRDADVDATTIYKMPIQETGTAAAQESDYMLMSNQLKGATGWSNGHAKPFSGSPPSTGAGPGTSDWKGKPGDMAGAVGAKSKMIVLPTNSRSNSIVGGENPEMSTYVNTPIAPTGRRTSVSVSPEPEPLPRPLDPFPSDAQLDILTTGLGQEWQRLGVHLGLSLASIDMCQDTFNHPHMTILRMLIKWRDKSQAGLSQNQIVTQLQRALSTIGNRQLAEYVSKWLPPSPDANCDVTQSSDIFSEMTITKL